MEKFHIYIGSPVTHDGACQYQDKSQGAAPSAQLFYRFVSMLFPHHIHNVGAFQIA